MHNFRKLKVWSEGMDMAVDIYQLTKEFPKEEKFGLISQLRRAAVSIPSNIAEGAGRATNKDFAQFLSIATGSSYELESQLELAVRVNFVDREVVFKIIERLHSLQKKIHNFRDTLLKE